MKKIITFLLFIGVIKVGAQSYQKMLADSVTQFHIVPLYIPILIKDGGAPQTQGANCVWADWGDWYAKNDSLYNSLVYKKFYFGTNFEGLMREDTVAKKVYFIQYCNTTEELLYDFSLQVGNTISYTFPNSWGSVVSGTFTVDSIKLVHDYQTYWRRHFYLRNHGAGNDILEMIEGVGNVNHPLFLYYTFGMGMLWGSPDCPGSYYDEILSCKWDNGAKTYIDSCALAMAYNNSCVGVADTCHYQTTCSGIEEFSGIKNILAYPNPVSDLLTLEIETEKQLELSLSLVNVLGIEVKKESRHQLLKGKNNIKLNVKELPDGIYLARFTDDEKATSKVILVRR